MVAVVLELFIMGLLVSCKTNDSYLITLTHLMFAVVLILWNHEKIYMGCMCVPSSVLSLCDCMDYRPPGSSVHGILQARVLEWVAIPSFRGSPHPGMEPKFPGVEPKSLISPAWASGFFTTSTIQEEQTLDSWLVFSGFSWEICGNRHSPCSPRISSLGQAPVSR